MKPPRSGSRDTGHACETFGQTDDKSADIAHGLISRKKRCLCPQRIDTWDRQQYIFHVTHGRAS
eukprot:1194133-Prymnesium_polylepis.3